MMIKQYALMTLHMALASLTLPIILMFFITIVSYMFDIEAESSGKEFRIEYARLLYLTLISGMLMGLSLPKKAQACAQFDGVGHGAVFDVGIVQSVCLRRWRSPLYCCAITIKAPISFYSGRREIAGAWLSA